MTTNKLVYKIEFFKFKYPISWNWLRHLKHFFNWKYISTTNCCETNGGVKITSCSWKLKFHLHGFFFSAEPRRNVICVICNIIGFKGKRPVAVFEDLSPFWYTSINLKCNEIYHSTNTIFFFVSTFDKQKCSI